MSELRTGIGQHRVIGRDAAPNNGQKSRLTDIGQGSGGEEHSQDRGVPGSSPINSGVPIHGAEENDFDRANRHGKS